MRGNPDACSSARRAVKGRRCAARCARPGWAALDCPPALRIQTAKVARSRNPRLSREFSPPRPATQTSERAPWNTTNGPASLARAGLQRSPPKRFTRPTETTGAPVLAPFTARESAWVSSRSGATIRRWSTATRETSISTPTGPRIPDPDAAASESCTSSLTSRETSASRRTRDQAMSAQPTSRRSCVPQSTRSRPWSTDVPR